MLLKSWIKNDKMLLIDVTGKKILPQFVENIYVKNINDSIKENLIE